MTQLANTRNDITVAPQKSTQRRRTCLGIKVDGAYCNAVFEAIDGGERLCLSCRVLNKSRRGKHGINSTQTRRLLPKGDSY